jgi:hypothetical protein
LLSGITKPGLATILAGSGFVIQGKYRNSMQLTARGLRRSYSLRRTYSLRLAVYLTV